MADFACSCPYDFDNYHDCLDCAWNEEEGIYEEFKICYGCPFAGQLSEFFS